MPENLPGLLLPHCGDLTRLYPGVPETLEKLAGKKLAVLSNKLQRLTEAGLGGPGDCPFFGARRGGGAGLPLKPSPEPLTAMIRDLGVEPGRTLMVGDKPADIRTGRGAGARSPRSLTATASWPPCGPRPRTSSWPVLTN